MAKRKDQPGRGRDEGQRKREEQRRLIAKLLGVPAEPAEASAPTPEAPTSVTVVDTPEPAAAPPTDLGDAVLEVLEDVGAPMVSDDIAEWLEDSGVHIDATAVTDVLAGAPAGRVLQDLEGRWSLQPTHLDDDQRRVAHAPVGARQLVIAGPGAGKTEVACARAAHALDSGIPARSVLVISFTRAATSEVRDRIARLTAAGPKALRGIEVRTLDSLAWILQRHLTEEDLLGGSHADNIARMIQLLKEPPEELTDYLASMKLVIVDEAQDFVGLRSELALRLITALPRGAGVTVFADPAQAIYGDWALEEGDWKGDERPLHERIVAGEVGEFVSVELSGSHRTTDETLVRIARDLRTFALVRDVSAEAEHAYEEMRQALTSEAGIDVRRYDDMVPLVGTQGNQLFLFRTHGEVVQLSSYLSSAGVRHRLRFPGLPKPIHPWIGRLLGRGGPRRLSHDEFERLWVDRVAGTAFDSQDPDGAWEALLAVAGDPESKRVDTLYLREILSRRSPPDEVCRPTLGASGPILGTVHGSKGREAEEVVLGLTALRDSSDHAEETRILYVGATRARRSLTVADIPSHLGYLRSRRAWRHTNRQHAVQLEFGLDGDVDPLSPVSRRWSGDARAVDLQERFAGLTDHDPPVRWQAEKSQAWANVLRLDADDAQIATCDDSFNRDLWELVNKFPAASRLRPPDAQHHLRLVDFTTVARDNDSPDLNQVTTTFAESGFWVAPLVKGMSLAFLNWRRG